MQRLPLSRVFGLQRHAASRTRRLMPAARPVARTLAQRRVMVFARPVQSSAKATGASIRRASGIPAVSCTTRTMSSSAQRYPLSADRQREKSERQKAMAALRVNILGTNDTETLKNLWETMPSQQRAPGMCGLFITQFVRKSNLTGDPFIVKVMEFMGQTYLKDPTYLPVSRMSSFLTDLTRNAGGVQASPNIFGSVLEFMEKDIMERPQEEVDSISDADAVHLVQASSILMKEKNVQGILDCASKSCVRRMENMDLGHVVVIAKALWYSKVENPLLFMRIASCLTERDLLPSAAPNQLASLINAFADYVHIPRLKSFAIVLGNTCISEAVALGMRSFQLDFAVQGLVAAGLDDMAIKLKAAADDVTSVSAAREEQRQFARRAGEILPQLEKCYTDAQVKTIFLREKDRAFTPVLEFIYAYKRVNEGKLRDRYTPFLHELAVEYAQQFLKYPDVFRVVDVARLLSIIKLDMYADKDRLLQAIEKHESARIHEMDLFAKARLLAAFRLGSASDAFLTALFDSVLPQIATTDQFGSLVLLTKSVEHYMGNKLPNVNWKSLLDAIMQRSTEMASTLTEPNAIKALAEIVNYLTRCTVDPSAVVQAIMNPAVLAIIPDCSVGIQSFVFGCLNEAEGDFSEARSVLLRNLVLSANKASIEVAANTLDCLMLQGNCFEGDAGQAFAAFWNLFLLRNRSGSPIRVEDAATFHRAGLCVKLEAPREFAAKLLKPDPKNHIEDEKLLQMLKTEIHIQTKSVTVTKTHKSQSSALKPLWPHEIEVAALPGMAVDMANLSTKTAVECDGQYHFVGKRYNARSRLKGRLLAKAGWRVFRIPARDWDSLANEAEKQDYVQSLAERLNKQ